MSLTRSYLLVPALAFTVTAAKAAIINVPGDQPTIQAAIDIAVFGDEVVVAPGIYTEAIDFVGKAITVRSSSGPVATTIRAAGPRDSVVKCVSGEGQTTVLDGFRITGANNNGGPGGLEIFGSSPTIRNCIVAGNLGSAGGMSNEDSSPAVINCIFIDNTGVGGGGMDNRSSDPMVVNCLFIDNTAAFGGGMRNIFSSSPMIVNCAFVGNNAVLDGGGMSNSIGGSPTIFNCTFFGNEAALDGGAMASTTGCHPTLRNGVVWGNIGGGVRSGREPPVRQSSSTATSKAASPAPATSTPTLSLLIPPPATSACCPAHPASTPRTTYSCLRGSPPTSTATHASSMTRTRPTVHRHQAPAAIRPSWTWEPTSSKRSWPARGTATAAKALTAPWASLTS